MTVTVADVVHAMDAIAPPHLAFDGDRIGLQLGDPSQPVRKLVVTLEVTPAIADRAIAWGADIVVAHHALLFRPLTEIRWDKPRQAMVAKLVSHRVAFFAAHTNLDCAWGGVNDVIAERLGIVEPEPLEVTVRDRLVKLVVFVPASHVDAVRQALGDAGAGHIGAYSHCTFGAPGTGSFKPGPGTRPYIGKEGKLELVDEVRLETIAPERDLGRIVQRMLEVHPYEEVAYDVYPLELTGRAFGIGRVGRLPAAMELAAFVDHVRRAFRLPHLRYAGRPGARVETVAVLGGSGSGWIPHALAQSADVLVTADVSHHQAADAVHDGIAIVDVPHAALEAPVCERVADGLRHALGDAVEVRVDVDGVDPWRFV
ncbi:Nif3-like dinuclear metal center hexameric protein [Alicyclobacillus vulcanalis]|uniref:GTP cyclohydrolase 1 type 2 homolog n=1 Tax=Alicyclobacillus vulcanalis TaxID=252246 RepID=A0A1N7KY69_9BACL|nr:Nif3-like dinuclear metal center hexameric protein [Alicyclobacillus vulcanalis]SIS66524.1 dinuclear metal center protein, YbgI/SA1388 family [Alicyclobacillus vulcanalis]